MIINHSDEAWKKSCIKLKPACVLLQKRFAEAKEIYSKGIENCPDSSDLHNNYGVFLVDTGQLKYFQQNNIYIGIAMLIKY